MDRGSRALKYELMAGVALVVVIGKVLSITSTPGSGGRSLLREIIRQPGATVRHLRDGRQVVRSGKTSGDVSFVSSNGEVLIQVYGPSPTRALALVLSGRVRPVNGS